MSETLRGRDGQRTVRLNLPNGDAKKYLDLTGLDGAKVRRSKIRVGDIYWDGGEARTVFPGSLLIEITGTDAQIDGVIRAARQSQSRPRRTLPRQI